MHGTRHLRPLRTVKLVLLVCTALVIVAYVASVRCYLAWGNLNTDRIEIARGQITIRQLDTSSTAELRTRLENLRNGTEPPNPWRQDPAAEQAWIEQELERRRFRLKFTVSAPRLETGYVWRFKPNRRVTIPLWIPLLVMLVIDAFVWSWYHTDRRRALGLCTHCGYNRAGLSQTSVCPECGSLSI